MKNILITGSSKGIGAAMAKKLAAQNHNVFLTGRNSQRIAELQKEIGGTGAKVGFLAGDLLEDGFLESLYNQAKKEFGSVDVLINNAGEYVWSPVEKADKKDIARLLKLNIQVPYELCSIVAGDMKIQKWGRIINIGSISGAVGEANASLYSASKAGLIGMTKALALELAEYGITVNVINPGWVKTGLMTECFECETLNEQEQLDMIPQKRFIDPEEVASLVEYLISEQAKGMTGQSLNLCAGLSLG